MYQSTKGQENKKTDSFFNYIFLRKFWRMKIAKKSLPIRKTAAPMKTARKIRPDLLATYSIKNANDPANKVPNPLLNPLHKVAPIVKNT